MADNIKTPPKFDGLNFPIWKVRMTIFLQSLGSLVAKALTKPYVVPDSDESTWTDFTFREYEANSKAQNSLLTALNEDDLTRVIHCQSAYEIWQHLLVTHEGTSQVKRAKIDLLRSQYENRLNRICLNLESSLAARLGSASAKLEMAGRLILLICFDPFHIVGGFPLIFLLILEESRDCGNQLPNLISDLILIGFDLDPD